MAPPPAADMPAAEVDLDEALVRRLLAEQCPDLAGLALAPLAFGWDNAVFRLGDDLVVRLPRRQVAVALLEHEQRWLPELAPTLPLPVPVPLRTGRPSTEVGYPWPWSVCRWLDGDVAARRRPDDLAAAARTLGDFVRALHRPAPRVAPANPQRGVPLRERTSSMRLWLDRLEGHVVDGPRAPGAPGGPGDGTVDVAGVLARWEDLAATPPWTGAPVWLHGDLHLANVLVHDGRLSAVIDFGDLTAGDPAGDLFVAWQLFGPDLRPVFRDAVGDVDDDTWRRAEGWALLMAVAYLANAADHPLIADLGRHSLAALGFGATRAENGAG